MRENDVTSEIDGMFGPAADEAKFDELEKRHHGCQFQRSYHGCGRVSMQVFDNQKLVADYDVLRPPYHPLCE